MPLPGWVGPEPKERMQSIFAPGSTDVHEQPQPHSAAERRFLTTEKGKQLSRWAFGSPACQR